MKDLMKQRYLVSCVVVAFLLGFTLPASVRAQTAFGTILGTVTDTSGAVVPRANVTVTNEGTNVSSRVKTGGSGDYVVPNLIPGKYRVVVEVAGFKKFVAADLTLLVDQNLRIDARLAPGAVTTSVEVTAQGQMINTDSSTVGQVVENKAIVDLPLISRNFMDLAILSPGVIADNTGVLGSEESLFRSALSGGAIFVSGARASSNGYMIDGVENNDPGFQTPTITPPIDAIQEFKLMNQNYSAEFGGSAVQLNIAIKSGTNQLHGTAYDFVRNDALDGTNFFAVKDPITGKSKPQLRYNQFGVSLGGPIVLPKIVNGRNKLFFFGDYEGTRQLSYTSAFGRYPTADELGGNFSADPPIYDPLTGQQFPGNIIPTTMIDPKIKQVLALGIFPSPNVAPQPGFNTVKRLANPDTINQETGKVDYTISEKDTLSGRVSYSNENILSPGIAPLSGTTYQQKGWNAEINEIHLFSPTVVNNFRLGFNRPLSLSSQDGAFGTDLAGQLFTGVATDPATYGLPVFSLVNYSGVGGACCSPLDYFTTSEGAVDDLTIIRGKHSLKVGGTFRTILYKEINSYDSRGIFYFSGQFTAGPGNTAGNAVADFLLGDAQSASVNQGLSTSWYNAKVYAGYVEDNWKATQRLTFNLGLRYEYDSPLYEQQNRISVVDFSYPGGRLLTPNQQIVNQLNSPLLGYTPKRGLISPDYRNWAPRFGFAYRPFGGNNTVVRGGYGIFYDTFAFNEYSFSNLNPPWASSYAATSTLGVPVSLDGLFPIAPSAAPVAGSISALTLDAANRTPYSQQWNLDVQRELAPNWVVDVGYQGSLSLRQEDRNFPIQGQLMPNGTIDFHYPNFGFMLLTAADGRSNYNAMTARIEKRFSHGYYFEAHYTWSKALGIASSECGLGTDACFGEQNYWDRNADYGPQSYDVTNSFVTSAIYQLPFGRGERFGSHISGALNTLLGGWQLNGIYQIHTGFPFSINAFDASGTGSVFQNSRANLVGNPNAPDPVDPSRVFNRYAFAQPGAGTFGNSGRNILRGNRLDNIDMSLFKNQRLTERFTLQFRTEWFNALNHTQFGPFPGQFFSLDPASNFGIYQSTQVDSRVIQMALKLIF